MKYLLLTSFICLSLSALAKPINPRDYTCEDLQEMISEKGSVYMRYGLFGISRGTVYSPDNFELEDPCAWDEEPSNTKVRTKDKWGCFVGYTCVFID